MNAEDKEGIEKANPDVSKSRNRFRNALIFL
jgi:hypothetical protein